MSPRASHPIVGPSAAIRTPWGWRDPATGRWTNSPSLRGVRGPPGPSFTITLAPKKLWRFSYGVTFVEHGNYYGGIIQAWSTSRRILEDARSELVATLNSAIRDFLGFEDWMDWSFVKSDGEGFQEVRYQRDLEGRWEYWIEDDKGVALRHEKGDLS